MWNVLSTVPVGVPVALVLPVGCQGGAFYFCNRITKFHGSHRREPTACLTNTTRNWCGCARPEQCWPFADRNARNGASKGPKDHPAPV